MQKKRSATNSTNTFIFFLLAVLAIMPLSMAESADEHVGMCHKQPPIMSSEISTSMKVISELKILGPGLPNADEESIVRSFGLTASRMNCVLGKLMAGNDIFDWGQPEAYGVELSDEEIILVKQHQSDSLILKTYLEENLNIEVEKEP